MAFVLFCARKFLNEFGGRVRGIAVQATQWNPSNPNLGNPALNRPRGTLSVIRLDPTAPFPDERFYKVAHLRIVVCNNVKTRFQETHANDLNPITPKRPHAITEKLNFRFAARLLVANDERPIWQPQCRNLGERNMLVSQPFALNPVIRVKEDEVSAAHRSDELVGP